MQRRLQTFLNIVFARPFNRRRPDVEGLGDNVIGRPSIGLEQDVGSRQLAGRHLTFLGQGQQVRPLVLSQGDKIFLGHGSPHFLPQYTVRRTWHQNCSGRPLDGEAGVHLYHMWSQRPCRKACLGATTSIESTQARRRAMSNSTGTFSDISHVLGLDQQAAGRKQVKFVVGAVLVLWVP